MSKILYIFKLTKDDIGPKEHVKNILKYSLHDIDVITNNFDSIWSNFLKKCILDKTKSTFLNIVLFQIYSGIYIMQNKKVYDSILIRQSVGFFLLPILSRALGINVIIEVNGFQYQDLIDRKKILLAKINNIFEFLTYRFASKVICVHKNIQDNLVHKFEILQQNSLKVIENGIEPIEYISVTEAKANENIPLREFRIGYLGSFAHREGVDILPIIAKYMKNTKVKFIIIGGTPEEVKIYHDRLKELNLEDMFEITSYLPIKLALKKLQTCDVCIHLRRPMSGKSNSQGSPLKMLDYHNVGRYVVASNIESYQYIKKFNFGVLVDMNKKDFIDDIISNIYKITQLDIENHGRRANDFIQDKSWYKQIKKLDIELIREVDPINNGRLKRKTNV